MRCICGFRIGGQIKRAQVALIGLVVCVIACCEPSPVRKDPLNGAWGLVSMHLILADGKSIEIPVHESLIIFADGYYSIGYAFGDGGSILYEERWHPSDSEKVARFGSVIVNAGSYRLDGSRIDARPLFALAPEFVDGEGVFSFAFKADTLELTWERSVAFDGLEYPSGGTVTLLRLVRIKHD
jgi:hypothetical protein